MDPYAHEPLVADYGSYEAARDGFEWDLPDAYNIATDLVETQPEAETLTALVFEDEAGDVERLTFADVDRRSNRVANLLAAEGVAPGDRVAVVLPDVPETPCVHMAVYKTGAILVPLSPNYGPDELAYRLRDSGAEYLFATPGALETVESVSGLADQFETVVAVGADEGTDVVLGQRRDDFEPTYDTRETSVDDPALMLYTSGTTGDPKGVLHGHGYLLGYYPGYETWNDLRFESDRIYWCNVEWSFTGSLVAHFYSTWHYGGTYVARTMADNQDPDEIFDVLADRDVSNTFLRPGDLQAMMDSRDTYPDLPALDVVSTGGAPYGEELVEWVESTLGATPVEVYGQTEANMFVCECPAWYESRPASLGKAVPGANVAVVNQYGDDVGEGAVGELALDRDHPTVFERYWDKPEKTEGAFVDGWMLTGSMCQRDADGYYEFVARKEDLIAAGDRYVSPADVEAVVNERPEVALSGVVAGSDGGVHAYVSLTDEAAGREEEAVVGTIAETLPDHLAPHEVPDEITVVPEVPTTERGKVRRTELRDDG